MAEANANPASDETETTPRVLGGLAAFSVVAGSMLGIGIFISPPQVANYLSSPWVFMLMWVFAGITALAGAVACAELGAMMPRSGGDYVFQREAFGPSVAFASGWVLYGAIFTGSIALVAVPIWDFQLSSLLNTFASDYTWNLGAVATSFSLGGDPINVSWAHLGGVLLVIALTGMNIFGAKLSGSAQAALTLIPIGLFTALGAVGLATGADTAPVAAEPLPLSATLLAAAYLPVYFAYSGWINVIYVAGEVKNPGRNIPRSLIGGTLVVGALYLFLCSVFILVLGMGGLANAGEAGSATAAAIGGKAGMVTVTILIALCLFATLNATILGGARVAFAMSRGGAFVPYFGKLNRAGVPARALWLQAAIACLFIVIQTYDQIWQMVGIAMLITGSLTVGALFVLRVKQPDAERPYRAFGYPWLPAIYLISSVAVIAIKLNSVLDPDPAQAEAGAQAWYPLIGLAILGLAYVGHRVLARHSHAAVAALLAVISALFLTSGTADAQTAPIAADSPLPPPAAVQPLDVSDIQRQALQARTTVESAQVRELYTILTCVSDPPSLDIPDYWTYCRRFLKYRDTYRDKFKDVAGPWIAQRRPAKLPGTVLYPFSGADLVSSVLAFPDAKLHVHVSLEHGGPVDAMHSLKPGDRWLALLTLLKSSRGLLNLGDSKTEHLREAHLQDLPGKLPITLVGLAAHEAEVVGIRYFEVMSDGTVRYLAPGEELGRRPKVGHASRFDARWSNFELSFRLPGSDDLRLLRHVAADLSNDGLLKKAPGVHTMLRGLGEVTFMTKAATYLMWSPDFTAIRDIGLTQAAWMISDASGVLPWHLDPKFWDVKVFGEYRCMLLNWVKAGGHWKDSDTKVASWYETKTESALEFRFGYIDCGGRNSVMIGSRRAPAP